jgi:ABC-type phosphate/phosphonate transport system substrate-binding protein
MLVNLKTECRRAAVFAALLLALLPSALMGDENAQPPTQRMEIHFAFSKSMFLGVNENDARAAMRIYARTIGDQNGLYVDQEPTLLEGTNEIAQALTHGRNDVFSLTTPEFLAVETRGLIGPFFCANIRGSFVEEYLLLSRKESTLRQIEDLKGQSLIISSDVRSCLAPCWLEVLCREHGLTPATPSFPKITFAPKPLQVVLPVFFGKADGCIVTRNAYEVMCELNPQLEKQLRIVAKSPPLIPSLSCFSRGTTELFRDRIFKALELSSSKPGYSQILTLFKADSVSQLPATVLDSTREFLARHRKLCGTSDKAQPADGT